MLPVQALEFIRSSIEMKQRVKNKLFHNTNIAVSAKDSAEMR